MEQPQTSTEFAEQASLLRGLIDREIAKVHDGSTLHSCLIALKFVLLTFPDPTAPVVLPMAADMRTNAPAGDEPPGDDE